MPSRTTRGRRLRPPGKRKVQRADAPDGRVIEVCNNPVPVGGFVVICSDITERKRAEAEIRRIRWRRRERGRIASLTYA